jgi:membrane fusion protein (multidrug efflux system)
MSENKKLNKKHIIILVIVVVGVLLGVYSFIRHHTVVTTDDAYVVGRVHTIAAKIPGTILRTLVQDNQAVKKGDLLVEIDSTDYNLKLNEAQATLEADTARLADAAASIKGAQINLTMQQVQFKQATQDKDRAQILFDKSVISKEKHEKTMTAYELSEQGVRAAQQQLDKAIAAQELAKAVIKQREATLEVCHQ